MTLNSGWRFGISVILGFIVAYFVGAQAASHGASAWLSAAIAFGAMVVVGVLWAWLPVISRGNVSGLDVANRPPHSENGAWELVGHVGVDSASVWIGDPSYVFPGAGGAGPWRDYDEFIARAGEAVASSAVRFGYDGAIHAGDDAGTDMGILVSSGGRDGAFPVFVLRDAAGDVLAVQIRFPRP
ncbi:MAG: hypothetical protein JSU68_04605 [Phycisphaerales bacterium]|nr:MAG: hypothetical protein JSU68_04605 [Phycisphaerales bacterium]